MTSINNFFYSIFGSSEIFVLPALPMAIAAFIGSSSRLLWQIKEKKLFYSGAAYLPMLMFYALISGSDSKGGLLLFLHLLYHGIATAEWDQRFKGKGNLWLSNLWVPSMMLMLLVINRSLSI